MRRATETTSQLLLRTLSHYTSFRYNSNQAAYLKHAAGTLASSSGATGDVFTCRASSNTHAALLDGRAVAAAWERELIHEVRALTGVLGRPPGLGVVLVGSRPDSMLYVTKKQEACQKAGMQTFVHHLPESVSQAQLEAAVSHACADCRVDGVLIQLPLPRHLSEEAVMEVLDPRKDVDGFHPLNMGRMLMRGRGVRLVPATPLGCIELLRRSGVDVQGKTCVVLGDSNIVGTPLAAMLRDRGAAAVTICHRRSYREWFEDQDLVQRKRAAAAVCLPRLPGPSPPPPHAATTATSSSSSGGDTRRPPHGSGRTADCFQSYQLPDLTRSADILVVAVGHPELVRRDWVRPGAVVIDVGINVVSSLPRNRGQQPPNSASEASPETTQTSEGVAASDRAAAAGSGSDTPVMMSSPDDTSSVASGGNNITGGGSAGAAGNSLSYNRNVVFQVVGDVAFEEVSQVAGAITPVPGGVGPMTIAAVLHNTIKAAKYSAGLEPW